MEEDFPTDIGLDELLAMLSHELRTPLTTILGWSRVLRARTFNEDTCRRALEAIEGNALAQVQIIDALLAVSEVITGKVRLNLRPLDLVTLIRGAITVARPALDARTIRAEATLDPAAAAFVGDPDRLQRAVANVLATPAMGAPAGGGIEGCPPRARGDPPIAGGGAGERSRRGGARPGPSRPPLGEESGPRPSAGAARAA